MSTNHNPRKIPEKDWKLLRALQDEKISIFCERTLSKLSDTIASEETTPREKYKKVWKILNKEDDKLGLMFDDLRRSTAVQKLGAWRRFGLLTDEELAQLSEDTQRAVEFFSTL